jgi:transcriptional regulator with XRE-family HTH domain
MKCPHCNGTGELEGVSVGALVLTMRKARGLTQQELSEACGLSRGQIANLETDRTDLSIKALFRVAKALECAPRDLMP